MQLSCATARLSAASPLASQRQQPGAARRAACLRVQCAAADVEGLRERAAKAACAVALSLSLFAGGVWPPLAARRCHATGTSAVVP